MPKLTQPINKDDHIQGPANARITLVEYGDFQCPYCGMAYPIIKNIQAEFGKKLRFVFRHFPLPDAHPMALPAAIASEAAARQQRFWEMHDMIYERQSALSSYAFAEFATELDLNITQFKMDLQDEILAEIVESHFESGIRSGVNGTPSFYINGYKYNGSNDYDSLYIAIEESMQLA
ncbi:MAG TPA: DsbA family protein [Chitinophagaceae bacterium]|nr:DsbA family protein [Chitinophagaceae bacterium]